MSTSKKVDIILSHCESGRRLSLFDFDTTYIFTGHFNSYVLYVDKKVFIALDNIPKTTPSPIIKTSYVTVDIGASRDKIQYQIDDNIYVFVKDEKSLSNKFENIDGYYAIIPKAMQLSMEKLVKLKKNNERINSDDMWQFPGIPISTINDYLGKKSDK